MAWAVLALIAVHSALEYPLWYGPFQIAFGLCIGLLSGLRPPVQRRADESLVEATQAFALGLMLACGYAAWDYHRVSQIYLPVEARAQAYRDDPLPLIRRSWLFRNQARFAELTITPLTRDNAQWTLNTALAMLHYSPEPRVIEKAIESATLLGRQDEAVWHAARYRAAFPASYAAWAKPLRGKLEP
jgi:hypothetical protein